MDWQVWAILLVASAGKISWSAAWGLCDGVTRGRHFIIAFTGNVEEFPQRPQLYLMVVAFSDVGTTVNVNIKYTIKDVQFDREITVEGRGFNRLKLPGELHLGRFSNRSNRVIDVKADRDISVYGLNYHKYSTDVFLAIPVASLGVSYVAVSYAAASSLFAVVGTEDGTRVSVSLSATVTFEGDIYYPGSILDFEVDGHEVVQLVTGSNEYIGVSIVKTDKPVAIFSGNVCASTPFSACDTLAEQVVPVTNWGKKHIFTATGSPQDASLYVIHAYYDDTYVNIPGSDDVTLQPGEYWQGEINGNGVITTSQPASVMQVLQTIRQHWVDPSIMQVPSRNQFDYTFGFSTPPKPGEDDLGFFNFFNIVVKKGESNTISLNGKSLISFGNFTRHTIPDTDYELFIVEVPKGEGVYFVEQISHNGTSPISAIVYGYEYFETYGFSAGLSLTNDKSLLNLNPFFLREVGNETLLVTLPCVNTVLSKPVAYCRFQAVNKSQSKPDCTDVKAYVVDNYTLICNTTRFSKIGYITVKVSLNDKKSFDFKGNIYVVSQDVLPPTLTVQQTNFPDGIVDLSSSETIRLSWAPKDLPAVQEVELAVQIATNTTRCDGKIWTTNHVIESNIENNGVFEFVPEKKSHLTSTSRKWIGMSTPIVFVLIPVKYTKLIFHAVSSGFLISLHATKCETKTLNPHTKGVKRCPCTHDQASADFTFQRDEYFNLSYFHPGANSCFRSANETGSAGQKCCYMSDGNILVQPQPGSGSANPVSLGNAIHLGTIWHYFYDVIPWLSCCKFNDQCETYYEYRPSDDCSKYVPPRPTFGTGDPHFKTLDGKEFTFNGAGEFLMLRSLNFDLTFQARMEILPGTNASVYTAFVLALNDSVPVQVERSSLNNTLIFIDGIPVDLYHNGLLIRKQHFKGLHLEVNQDLTEVRIRLLFGVTLVIRNNLEMMSFVLQLPEVFKGQVEGLLGNFNDDPDDDFFLANGSFLHPNSSLEAIHFDFGLSWILNENNTIFKYFQPRDFSSFSRPSFIPILQFPDVNDVSADVQELCGTSLPCLFDAVSTGSLCFANQSLREMQDFEIIQKNTVKIVSCGYPGKVPNGGISGNIYLVGNNVSVFCNDGFHVAGSSLMTCEEDGNWSAPLSTCNKNVVFLEPWEIGLIVVGCVAFFTILTTVIVNRARKECKKYDVKAVASKIEGTAAGENVYEQGVEIQDTK